jgi:hypothetical protein
MSEPQYSGFFSRPTGILTVILGPVCLPNDDPPRGDLVSERLLDVKRNRMLNDSSRVAGRSSRARAYGTRHSSD